MAKKEFPNIEGSEMISKSWARLLIRDNSVQTQFSGTEFPDVTLEDVGRTCYRTDIPSLHDDKGTWFIFCGFDAEDQPVWWDVFGSLTSNHISIEAKSDFPSSVTNVDEALRFVANKSMENAIVFPAEYTVYISDGVSTKYKLPKVSTNKGTVNIFLSGVLQSPETYEISEDAQFVELKEAPPFGEEIQIRESASILEYDIMPYAKEFTGDGVNKEFDCSPVNLINEKTIQVNVDGKILQFSEYTVVGSIVTLNNIPSEGSKIQIQTIYKGQLISPSPNTVNTDSIQDSSITTTKLADGLVTGDKLAENSVSDSKIINSSVITSKIADKAITSQKLADKAVDETKITDALKNKLLGSENINTNNLANGSVTKIKLGPDVLTEATTGSSGVVTLATKEEILNGTGGNKVVTASVLKEILDSLSS